MISRPVKTVVATVHVITSVGMLVVTSALVAFQLQPSSGSVPMSGLATRVLTPIAALALASGVVLALVGPWGLLRWRWVIAKLQISGMLTVVGLVSLAVRLDPETLLVARCCALVALVVLVALSMAKPWGRTPRHRSNRLIHWTRGRALIPARDRAAR